MLCGLQPCASAKRRSTGGRGKGNPVRALSAFIALIVLCAIAADVACAGGRPEFDPASKGSQPVADENPSLKQNTSYHPVLAPGRSSSSALRLQLLGGLNHESTIGCTDCHRTESGAALKANYDRTLDNGKGGAPYTSYDSENFALCFLCHDEEAFTCQPEIEDCKWTKGPKTNFYSTYYDTNLHASHVAGKGTFSPTRLFTSCANCHYNTHSNAGAANTKFAAPKVWKRTTGKSTRLVDFSPIVGPNSSANYGKPVWGCIDWFVWRAGCNFSCHGFDQELYYMPPDVENTCGYK